jgi:alkylation response protein AidB-like acyl-CoA dehydrogenase
MRFELSETQQLLKSSTRKFFSAECPTPEVRRIAGTDTAYDEALWRKMADQGWTGMIFPEEYGGSGLGLVEMAAAFEEMGRALCPGPFLSTVAFAGSLIDAAANEEQKKKYLAPIGEGGARATVALLEESATWDPEGVTMRATRSGSGYSLTGRKLFVADAAVADFLTCVARVDGELALLTVCAKAQGLTITPMPALDLTRRIYEVEFENVGADDVLAVGNGALAALERALDVATVALVSEMVGGMQRVLETTVGYAKTRKQFGKPIGQFQAVQHQCADMLLMTESSRSAAYYAAWALSERVPEASTAVSVAKTYASDAYREVGNRGIQVHGGMGFTWENDLHLYYRRAKASENDFGDANYHRERIARLVIDKRTA